MKRVDKELKRLRSFKIPKKKKKPKGDSITQKTEEERIKDFLQPIYDTLNFKDYDEFQFIMSDKDKNGINMYFYFFICFMSTDIYRYDKIEEKYKDLKDLILYVEKKTKMKDGDIFEFYGDRILYYMIVLYIYKEKYDIYGTPFELIRIRNKIASNIFLRYKMMQKKLCKKVIKSEYSIYKTCSDSFEAIIGFLYYYLKNKSLGIDESLFEIKDWLYEEWGLDDWDENIDQVGQFKEFNDYLICNNPPSPNNCSYFGPEVTQPVTNRYFFDKKNPSRILEKSDADKKFNNFLKNKRTYNYKLNVRKKGKILQNNQNKIDIFFKKKYRSKNYDISYKEKYLKKDSEKWNSNDILYLYHRPYEFFNQVNKVLKLNNEIDPIYIYIAFRDRSFKGRKLRKILYPKYDWLGENNEKLSIIGNMVYKTAFSLLMMNQIDSLTSKNASELTQLFDVLSVDYSTQWEYNRKKKEKDLVYNNIFCILDKANLCKYVMQYDKEKRYERCDMVFNAIIGAIFLSYYSNRYTYKKTIEYIILWLKKVFKMNKRLSNAIKTLKNGKYIDVGCVNHGYWGKWVYQDRDNKVIKYRMCDNPKPNPSGHGCVTKDSNKFEKEIEVLIAKKL